MLTQTLSLDVGTYLLEFQYFYPYVIANRKTLLVYFNNALIFSHTPIVSSLFDRQKFSQLVVSKDEVNNLSLTMKGPKADSVGFRVSNISLRRFYN